jgi:Domain of unknown function (DUF4440)
MGVTAFLSTLLIGAMLSGGNATADRKGKTGTTETKKGGSSSSSSKPSHVQAASTSKGANKSSSKDGTKDSGKENKTKSNNAYAAAAPLDNSKAGLQAVEVDMITRLEKDGIEAGLKKNRSWFQNYLADDLTGTNSDGVAQDKSKLMARALDPANMVESKTYDELTVKPYGEDVMIASGKVSEKGKSNNSDYNVQRTFMHVWVNRLGQWQQVAIQESAISTTTSPNQAAAHSSNEPPSSGAGGPSQSGPGEKP